MKISVFIIFIVLQTIKCEKAVSKLQRKLIVPKMNEKCKKIKCPSVEEPQCVRMRRHDIGLTLHIIAANKCELEYLKCHDDVEAKIVSMKNCGHHAAQTAGKNKKSTGKAHIRVKRKTLKYHASGIANDDKEKSSNGETDRFLKGRNANSTSNLTKVRNAKLAKLWQNKNWAVLSKFDVPKINKSDEKSVKKRFKTNLANSTKLRNAKQWKNKNWTVLSNFKVPRLNKLRNKSIKKAVRQIPKKLTESRNSTQEYLWKNKNWTVLSKFDAQKSNKTSESNIKKSFGLDYYYSNEDTDSNFENETHHKDIVFNKNNSKTKYYSMSLEEPDVPMFSNEFSSSDVVYEEYDEMPACPTDCPSRDVMVCAKCKHGVYKSFLSICHMRMFVCKHDDEDLQLISRYPCIMSAPYISEEWMFPSGRISLPEDDDPVLRFIACRELGYLGKKGGREDPRCKFPLKKENQKMYDYKGAQININKHYLLAKSGTDELEY